MTAEDDEGVVMEPKRGGGGVYQRKERYGKPTKKIKVSEMPQGAARGVAELSIFFRHEPAIKLKETNN